MTLPFKILGFVLIIFTTSAIGFLKSAELKGRYKKLLSINKSIANLKEQIRLHGGEIDRLLSQSFEKIPVDYSNLEKGDVEIVDEFFKNLGSSDTLSEYERCELYITLLKSRSEEAEEKYLELGRIYRSIGVMSGIFICIIFI